MSLPPLQYCIRRATQAAAVPQPVIEKDYALGYLLAGIAMHPVLASTLVFKGGTALKKLYFGDYRFSEDLDFSTLSAPQGEALEHALQESLQATRGLLKVRGPFTATLARYTEREPHPGGQDAFTVHLQFPWQPRPLCRIKLEITHDEPVLLPPMALPLLHGYEGETLTATITAYSLNEIIAEKLRSLLQTHAKLQARGWNRPRARDYYDLWRILSTFQDQLDAQIIQQCLAEKCAVRGVGYTGVEDFFTPLLVGEAERAWESNMGTFVRNLPSCQQVLTDLRTVIPPIISHYVENAVI